MNNNWQKLSATLTEMVDLYDVLLELGKKKQAALIAVRTEELDSLTKQEELVIIKIGKHETARIKLAESIAAAAGLSADVLTLEQMQELAGPEISGQLEKAAADFDRIVAELAPLNERNADLIQQALGFINYNLNLLAQSAAGPIYNSDGNSGQESQARKLVDKKV